MEPFRSSEVRLKIAVASLTSSLLGWTIRRRWLMSSVFQGMRLTIGLRPGPSSPPLLRYPSTKPSIADPGDSSTLNGSGLILPPPVFVMAHWVQLRMAALLRRPSGSTRSSRIHSMHMRRWPRSPAACVPRPTGGMTLGAVPRNVMLDGYKKTLSTAAREHWVEALGSVHRLVRSKRGRYWRSKINTRRDPASLWRTINEGLGRGGDGASHPATGLSAETFADFFNQKVSDVRSATDGAPAPEVRDISTADRFLSFAPITTDIVCRMVNEAVNKFSMKDPMPTWLLK